MLIANQRLWRKPIELPQVVDRSREEPAILGTVHIAQVLGQHGLGTVPQRQRDLLLTADGQQRWDRNSDVRDESLDCWKRLWSKPTTDAQHNRAPRHRPDYRIIERPNNRAIVRQPRVGDLTKALVSAVFRKCDRFLMAIAARGNHRQPQLTKEQMVNGGRGKEDADRFEVRPDGRRERRMAATRNQNDGILRPLQRVATRVIQLGDLLRHAQ
jgi:hypothetical protein